MTEKVLVAFSGGVDSSVACHLLKEQGYEVIGVYFQLGTVPPLPEIEKKALLNAQRSASQLGIKFISLDSKERFFKKVVKPFVRWYLRGRTPNPCAVCNPEVKFWALFQLKRELGAGWVATGHYARVVYDSNFREYQLLEAVDRNKDQSYFLFKLKPAWLGKIIFPLGEKSKARIKKYAQELGLTSGKKEESQDLCFVYSRNYAQVIEHLAEKPPREGDIITLDGKVLGRHKGIYYYTIGQHRGLGINEPGWYVVKILPEKNQIVVGRESELYHQVMLVEDLNWLVKVEFPLSCQAKIRYRSEKADCLVEKAGEKEVLVRFSQRQRAITPGQASVFYLGERVLGGGWIKEVIE